MTLQTWLLAGALTLMPSSNQASESQDLRIQNGDVELAATLTRPPGPRPQPAVLLLAGSGPAPRAQLRRFADHLNDLGFATLVYDKRGSGQSTGNWMTASLDDMVADAQAAIERLRATEGIDPNRVGVWGVSQAGWFIPVLASRVPSLAFAVVLTGGGSTPREVELFMHRASLRRAGASEADIAEAETLLEAYFRWLGGDGRRDDVVTLIERAKQKPWYGAIGIDRVMPSDANRKNWEWVARFDPIPFIVKMRVPTLVLLGEADMMGSSELAARRWREGFAKGNNTRAEVVTIPGMGHAATIGSSHAQGSAIMPAYLTGLEKFLASWRS